MCELCAHTHRPRAFIRRDAPARASGVSKHMRVAQVPAFGGAVVHGPVVGLGVLHQAGAGRPPSRKSSAVVAAVVEFLFQQFAQHRQPRPRSQAAIAGRRAPCGRTVRGFGGPRRQAAVAARAPPAFPFPSPPSGSNLVEIAQHRLDRAREIVQGPGRRRPPDRRADLWAFQLANQEAKAEKSVLRHIQVGKPSETGPSGAPAVGGPPAPRTRRSSAAAFRPVGLQGHDPEAVRLDQPAG